ncbi:hypothetical protein CONPUDRAFT_166204 [Coniophora puteana RWD-64-598 SS2]|uniref:Uncharacterized protein n=1 Tax=Coniophora puteana (strain RWD-64-598) TaxID=741705 RepID=A0A5M3MQ52_CONPW|nr:uncharacterized protein CONPUDRAFT_166204 [Coniophora puteana RWD-64-598 SS2]EIW80805.1 hypothetical protein CONPUDRAFT_166204 [Coniophora puteana RWD-64-598 SS2]
MLAPDVHNGVTLEAVAGAIGVMKLDDSTQLNYATSSDRSPIDQLPTEILSLILQLTQPPSVFLDRSNLGAWHSVFWKSQGLKLSLILVCRRWYSVGVERLYQDVNLRHPAQIMALSNTLSSNSELTSLIKTLSVNGISWTIYKPNLSLISFVRDLIHACPKLSRLDVYDLLHCTDVDELWSSIDSSPVLTLNIHQDSSRLSLYGFQACTSLVSLSLDLSIQRSDICESVTLPYLTDLHLRFTLAIERIPESLDVLTETWTMPELRAISIRTRDCEPAPSLARFLKKHGGHIRYLSLFLNWISQSYTTHVIPTMNDLPMLLGPYPAVEHLVLGPFDTTWASALRHSEVKWLDVFLETRLFSTEVKRASVERDLRGAEFPKLRGLRLIDRALTFSLSEDLPRALPPQEGPGDGERWTWQYPGMHIEYRKGVLERMNDRYLDTFIDASVDAFCDEASDASSSSCSCQTLSDSDVDGEHDEDEDEAEPSPHSEEDSVGSDLDTGTDSTWSQCTGASLSFSEVSFPADSSESELGLEESGGHE